MKKKLILIFIFCVFLTPFARCEDLHFDEKMKKDIETIESRHFKNKAENEQDDYRLTRLEQALMGRTFEELPIDARVKKLKIASQKKLLSGTSIPSSVRISSKKIDNDAIQITNENDVGIVDGLMRLYAPSVYEQFRRKNERMFRYEN